ncbi:MAG: response regulator [Deltaproteobacteria bacterium]|nr:response regulator [Deltaproteobacteria bacterium]
MARQFYKKRDRVLLVDDELTVAWSIGRYLTRAGFSISACGSVSEALELLNSKSYDVVITDIHMPGTSGLVLIDWIRDNRPNMRVVTITGFGSPALHKIAMEKGSILYLDKPVDVEYLVNVLRNDGNCSTFWGSIGGIDIFDYIQLILMTRQKFIVEIASKEGVYGKVFLNQGDVEHAVCDDITGEEAFYRILGFKGGRFTTIPWLEPVEKTIHLSGDFLMMEAARKKDERDINTPADAGQSRDADAFEEKKYV